MASDHLHCPKCGHEKEMDAVECAGCGITFALLQNTPPPEDEKETGAAQPSMEERMFTCPNCEHESISTDSCPKCEIYYLKYIERQEKAMSEVVPADENGLKDLEKKRQRLMELQKIQQEEERLEEARKKKQEAEELEALRRQKEERDRLEAQRRQEEEEKARAEALKREAEEKERAEALRKEAEERERIEAQRRQEEEEKARAEALKKEAEEKERAEALQKEAEERERVEAQRRQEEEEKARAEELKREAEEKEREKAEEQRRLQEEARLRAEALVKKKEQEIQERTRELAQKSLEAVPSFPADEPSADEMGVSAGIMMSADGSFPKEKEETDENIPAAEKDETENTKIALVASDEPKMSPEKAKKLFKMLKSRSSMKDVLKRYEGRMIGIDALAADGIFQARLIIANNDHFVVDLADNGTLRLFAYRTVWELQETAEFILDGFSSQPEVVPMVIRLDLPDASF